jgi:choline-glycine betaine transporter
MGIGLMFYGVAEPLAFYTAPPPGSVPPGDEVEALRTAMATSLFHWTLHPWAIYAVVGLAIAYSTFRKGRRQLISSAFVPLIGQRLADGWLGGSSTSSRSSRPCSARRPRWVWAPCRSAVDSRRLGW